MGEIEILRIVFIIVGVLEEDSIVLFFSGLRMRRVIVMRLGDDLLGVFSEMVG